MEGGVTIHVPSLPLVEIMLVAIAVLLWRILLAIHDGVRLLRALREDVKTSNLVQIRGAQEPKLDRQNRYPVDYGPTRSGHQEGDHGEPAAIGTSGGLGWSSEQPARPLHISAGHFRKCLTGDDDVDVALFIAACQNYCKVLALIGPFTLLSIREVHSNMKKIEHSFELAPVRYRSMRELLEAESAAGMHQPGGLIVDPSAAMGLLWARRGLAFWIHIFRDLLAQYEARQGGAGGPPDGPARSGSSSPRERAEVPTLKEVVEKGYANSLGPFNGWLSQNSMALAMRAVPAEFPQLAPSVAELIEDLREWSDVVEQLVRRMAAMQRELDLEDTRKSI